MIKQNMYSCDLCTMPSYCFRILAIREVFMLLVKKKMNWGGLMVQINLNKVYSIFGPVGRNP